MEAAGGRRVGRIGHLSRQRFGQEAAPVGMGHGPDQCLGVGVQGQRPERSRWSRLDHHAEVHDRDDVGDVAHDREVVRDQQQAERKPAREVDEQVRDLCLRGRIEGCERLVEDEDRRIRGQRAGDGNSLPLPAAELVRIADRGARREPDKIE